MRFARLSLLIVVTVSAFLGANAGAHDIDVTVSVTGTHVEGRATYFGGDPVPNAAIVVTAPGGSTLGKTQTGRDGRFSFPIHGAVDHRIRVDAADGHHADAIVRAEDLPSVDTKTGTTVDDTEIDTLRNEIRLLREDIDSYESTLRFRDIVGGIGYIAGIFGLLLYVKRRP